MPTKQTRDLSRLDVASLAGMADSEIRRAIVTCRRRDKTAIADTIACLERASGLLAGARGASS